MSEHDLIDLLRAADPVPAERLADYDVDADAARLGDLLATPRRPRRTAGRRRRVRRAVPVLAVALAAIVAALVVVLPGGGDRRSPSSAWAAELVRFAESSPLLLLDAEGWEVSYADEQSRFEGELQFSRGPSGPDEAPDASLNWRPGPIGTWVQDRAMSADARRTARVLGQTAQVFQYAGGRPGRRDITALFVDEGRVLEFRATVADLDAFAALLGRLKRVDTDTWLSAMPASVIRPAQNRDVVREMLRGVTVPAGFDPAQIPDRELTKDRYQLGATVTGTVACLWFRQWGLARRAGDPAKEREAVAAMATARDWPILREMAKDGGYPDAVWEYATAMPSGRWYGRPLLGDVDQGLGCADRGIDLPR